MKCTLIKKRKSIVLQFSNEKKQYLIYSRISLEDKQWDKKERKVTKKHPNHEELNQLIQKMKSIITTYLIEQNITGERIDLEELKSLLGLEKKTLKSKNSIVTIVDAFELFLEDRSHELAEKTIIAYKNSLRHLKDFQKVYGTIKLEEIDSKFRTEFLNYLKTVPRLSPNSRGKHIKDLKCVMNHLGSKGLVKNNQFIYFKKEKEPTPMVYTNHDELNKIYECIICTSVEKRILDMYCFMAYTGLRYSDYNALNSSNFSQKDGYLFLTFTQQKTKSKLSFPIIYQNAVLIAKKYDYQLPKMSNDFLNLRLKSVLRKYALIEGEVSLGREKMRGIFDKVDLITVHTARRSFATNQYLKGTPIHLIMAVTGHKSEKAFRVYIKAEQMEQTNQLIKYIDY